MKNLLKAAVAYTDALSRLTVEERDGISVEQLNNAKVTFSILLKVLELDEQVAKYKEELVNYISAIPSVGKLASITALIIGKNGT